MLAAKYCSLTDAAIRPRAATEMPFSLAHARIAARSEPAAGVAVFLVAELVPVLPLTFRRDGAHRPRPHLGDPWCHGQPARPGGSSTARVVG